MVNLSCLDELISKMLYYIYHAIFTNDLTMINKFFQILGDDFKELHEIYVNFIKDNNLNINTKYAYMLEKPDHFKIIFDNAIRVELIEKTNLFLHRYGFNNSENIKTKYIREMIFKMVKIKLLKSSHKCYKFIVKQNPQREDLGNYYVYLL